jgi:hypothetical protein
MHKWSGGDPSSIVKEFISRNSSFVKAAASIQYFCGTIKETGAK